MIRWEVHADAEAAARAAADVIGAAAREAIAERGSLTLAVSGGSTPTRMLGHLGGLDLPWAVVTVFQVDERLVPAGSPERSLTKLTAALPPGVDLRAMPVDDPEAGAERYSRELPAAFDLVHLGIGDDGHTASLVPGDAALDVVDRDVVLTAPYRGHRRMTLTFPVLDRARRVLWLATGAGKRGPLAGLRDGDPNLPAARVRAIDQLVICDATALPT